ncbi:Exo-poly-alpha-D-galacturonosidase precursor [Pirellulimonas nuda]|uniref:Exo-poly-alpha-D-galacturonosidase n=1 Tax=Pirellulimonas nuda TaxID=2528009 RepID=A0A518DBB4_9BACT|nr:glycoside hydrolase family 28 protein [Pirellulimonas nuda]QDU88769.1 Exo-poly-alpha-D-galacturonosidase precursor [Pirellulimonas nuda]
MIRQTPATRNSAAALLAVATLLASGRTSAAADVGAEPSTKAVNVKQFGAIGDGVASETAAIQRAIDACHDAGGGDVRVPAGDFQIGTIVLKSNVTLSLDFGASLLGSTDKADYPTDGIDDPREGGPHCLIYANGATNIAIEGLGVIDGRGTPEHFPRLRSGGKNGGLRPRLLRMVNCDGLTFSGLTWKRPAFWGLHLIDCKNVRFDAVTIRFRNNNYNNDGIDLDGCQRVLIENCDIDSGDDAICLKSSKNPCRNIVVRRCKVSSNTAALKFGTSSRGGFIDVSVTNCYFFNCPMGAIKLQSVDGGRLENVDISRIVMKNVGNPLFMRLGNRGSTFGDGRAGALVGTLKNIRVSDVVAEVAVEDRAKAAEAAYKNLEAAPNAGVTDKEKSKSGPIMITGLPGHYIEDVVLENIKISYPGNGTQEDAKRVVPEDEHRYPEQYFFGVLPAWGAYVRHAKNVQFNNVELSTRGPDQRDKIVLDDVISSVSEAHHVAPPGPGDWSKVRLFGHAFRNDDFTPEQYGFIRDHFSIFTIEKRHAKNVYGATSTEHAAAETAKKLLKNNPDMRVLLYWSTRAIAP